MPVNLQVERRFDKLPESASAELGISTQIRLLDVSQYGTIGLPSLVTLVPVAGFEPAIRLGGRLGIVCVYQFRHTGHQETA